MDDTRGAWRASMRPDELMAALVACVSGTRADDLGEVARILGVGLDASWCRVELWSGAGWRREDWPAPASADAGDTAFSSAVHLAGTVVGRLTVDFGSRPGLTDRARVRRLARVLGPVLHVHALQHELVRSTDLAVRRAGAVGRRRRRAVLEQEEERRQLERNLHDGAQHHLVALRMTVGLLEHDLREGALESARRRLHRFDALLDIAESNLAATAAGVLPAALVSEGLLPAFEAELSASTGVSIAADSVVQDRRYPPQVEVAVYFACLEAVNNARKHAPGAAVRVRLDHTYRGLSFRVEDDGPGFEPAPLRPRSGLRQLADRIEGAGGRLVVQTSPGAGTTVAGFMPI